MWAARSAADSTSEGRPLVDRVGAFCAIAVGVLVLFGLFRSCSNDGEQDTVVIDEERTVTVSAEADQTEEPGRPSDRSAPVSGY
jgi:hypothetical protein